MLTVLLPARSNRELTTHCLQSLFRAVTNALPPTAVEYVLLDDNSDPADGITTLFQEFKKQVPSTVRIVRFHTRQHYTGVFAHGLSLAKGDQVLFISNDMMLTPSFLRTVLAVSALDRTFGVVRGRSAYVDSHPEYVLSSPLPVRTPDDINAFAATVESYHGLQHRVDEILSGDCVLIRRELIDAIGVMDTRFYGYFGDPDYGLRAQRAGFKLVCALGAWLHHSGAGHILTHAAKSGTSVDAAMNDRMALVHTAFTRFREKWGSEVSPVYDTTKPTVDLLALRSLRTRRDASDYIAPLTQTPTVCDVF